MTVTADVLPLAGWIFLGVLYAALLVMALALGVAARRGDDTIDAVRQERRARAGAPSSGWDLAPDTRDVRPDHQERAAQAAARPARTGQVLAFPSRPPVDPSRDA